MKRIFAFVLIGLLGACTRDSGRGNLDGGGGGGDGGGGGGGDGGFVDNCPAEAKLVYTIDQNGTLSSFTPNQTDVKMSTFTTIGKLTCPAGGTSTPFSMSVDRSGTAWVEYVDQLV